jgi:hypothetical protein
MRSRLFTLTAALCGAVFFVACSSEVPTRPANVGPPTNAGLGSGSTNAATQTIAAMQAFPSGPELSGTSSLTRSNNGISMTVQANDLVPGNAYTVWFVIFNDPATCIDGCGVDDVLANRGVPSLRYAAGHVVGENGQGNFGGSLSEGDTGGPPCAADANLGICGPGLLDARTAVIHLVVRSHGAAIPDLVNDQISSFGGGCQVNTCANVQFAQHLPSN